MGGADGRDGKRPTARKMGRMLEPRAQHLLKTLIERYIDEGQPVGSRMLSRPL